jgi:hypothetical protein
MKQFIAALMLTLFVGAGVVYAKGEGVVLGNAWKRTNAVCATIAVKNDSTGNWDWNKELIQQNGDKAQEELAKCQAEADAAAVDPVGKACTGSNSVKNLNKLIKHAFKAISDSNKEDEEHSTDSK